MQIQTPVLGLIETHRVDQGLTVEAFGVQKTKTRVTSLIVTHSLTT